MSERTDSEASGRSGEASSARPPEAGAAYRETLSVDVESIGATAVGERTFALAETDGSVYLLGDDWVQTPPFEDVRDLAVGSYPHVLADGELQRLTHDGVSLRSFEAPDAVAVEPLLDRDAVAVVSPDRVVFLDEESYRERASAPLPVPAGESGVTGGFSSVAFATGTTLTWMTLDADDDVTAYQKEFGESVASVGFLDGQVVALTDRRAAGYRVGTGSEQWAQPVEGVLDSPRGRSRLLLTADAGPTLLAPDGTTKLAEESIYISEERIENHEGTADVANAPDAALSTPNRWRRCTVAGGVARVEQRESELAVRLRERTVTFDAEREAEFALAVENVGEEAVADALSFDAAGATVVRDPPADAREPSDATPGASIDADLAPGERTEVTVSAALRERFTDELELEVHGDGGERHSLAVPVEVPRPEVSVEAEVTNVEGGDADVRLVVRNDGDAPASYLELSIPAVGRTTSLPVVEPDDEIRDTATVEVAALESGTREVRVVDRAADRTHESTLGLSEPLLEPKLSVDEGDATTDPVARIGVRNRSEVPVEEGLAVQYAGRRFTQTLSLRAGEAGYVCVPLVGSLPNRFTVSVASESGLFETQRRSVARPSRVHVSRAFEIDGEGPYDDLSAAGVGRRITERVTVANRGARPLTGVRVEYPDEAATLASVAPRDSETVRREYVPRRSGVTLPSPTVRAGDETTEFPSVRVPDGESATLVVEPRIVLGQSTARLVADLRNETDRRCTVTALGVVGSDASPRSESVALTAGETRTVSHDLSLPPDAVAGSSGPAEVRTRYRVGRSADERDRTLPASVEVESSAALLTLNSARKRAGAVGVEVENASAWCLRDVGFAADGPSGDAARVADELEPGGSFDRRIEVPSRWWRRRRPEREFSVRATLGGLGVELVHTFELVRKKTREGTRWSGSITVEVEGESGETDGLLAFAPTVRSVESESEPERSDSGESDSGSGASESRESRSGDGTRT